MSTLRGQENWNELREAAAESRVHLVALVKAAQIRFELPQGDPERLSALMRALVHGAVDQALAGHLSAAGKGAADPEGLLDDLPGYLTQSAVSRSGDKAPANRRKTRAPKF